MIQQLEPSQVAGRGAALPRAKHSLSAAERDTQFVELLNGYRRSGGLARAADVFASLRQRGAPDIATVARWIVSHAVVHLEWEAQTWLPVFQFTADMQPHAAVRRSVLELAPVMEPWELAQWFTRGNRELAGRLPADVLAVDPEAVWQAARADRYMLDA